MREILFIHCAGPQGYHEGSNFLVRYLREKLGEDYDVVFPEMPDNEDPHYKKWKGRIKKELNAVDDDLILVGHSLGGSVILKYLSEENIRKPIAGLFLIGAVYWGKEDWEVEEFMLPENYFTRLTDIRNIFLYHSKDDEVVPVTHLRYYANELPNAKIREFEHSGHLFGRGLPELVEDIKSLKSW